MTKPPPGMRNGIFSESTPGGKVRVHLVQNGNSVGHFDATTEKLGLVAASILSAAHMAALASGRPSPQWRQPSLLQGAAIPATRVGLSEHQDPTLQILTVQVGETLIGFELPRSTVGELGQALYAASVSTSQRL
jgi:hypothetical protein